jgi:hypothetical protein
MVSVIGLDTVSAVSCKAVMNGQSDALQNP